MGELKQFKLPDVGEGLVEADIIKWHVKPGDQVEINQTLVEIETAKAVVELPSPYEGVVAELMVGEGDTVDVGVPIISVDVAAEGDVDERPKEPVPEQPSPAADPGTHVGPGVGPEPPKRQPVLVGYGVKASRTTRRPRRTAGAPAAQAAPGAQAPAAPAAPPPQAAPPQAPAAAGRPQAVDDETVRALAKPPVRKMAKDLGVDLTGLTGSGPQGSITRDDVRAAAEPRRAVPAAGEREERIPLKGVRRSMAAAMVESAFTAPHVTEFLQVDATATMETTRKLRDLPEFAEVKVSPLLLVARALLLAVRRHPMINATLDGDEIVVKRYVNLGIAAATGRGLIVPNIKDAHTLSLAELATSLAETTETARAGRASPADLTGGTITITNVGVFGVDAGTPILLPGESAILAFGQVRDMPWVYEGELAIRKVTTLALAFDHRIVDGELGSAVLRDVGAMVEDPTRIIGWS